MIHVRTDSERIMNVVMNRAPLLSIGALSRATGVPINTLRTWERRYGVPVGQRTEGGHRLYPAGTVEHVRLVVRALDAGHRPAQVLPVSVEQLRQLVAGAASRPLVPGGPIEAWIAAARALDGNALQRGFAEEAARLGLPAFVEARAIPFLRRLGEAWCAGELRVAHEHFASARLEDFLAGWWRPLADSASGPPVVCATLSGDHHTLGLHLAAALLAASGRRLLFLGPDTPTEDIVVGADQAGAPAIVVSVGSSVAEPERRIAELRDALPPRVGLFVGGPGAPNAVEGVTVVSDLPRLVELVGGR